MKIKIKQAGPPLSEKDLQNLEMLLGNSLPESYRNFLLVYNGGYPEPDFFPVPEWKYNQSLVNKFERVVSDEKGFGLIQIFEMKNDIFPEGFIPIGSDPGGNLILMSLSGNTRGKIYFWDHEEAPDDRLEHLEDYSNMYFLADSFEEFVNNLKHEDEL